MPVKKEAEERLELWLATLGAGDDPSGPLFRPLAKSREGVRSDLLAGR